MQRRAKAAAKKRRAWRQAAESYGGALRIGSEDVSAHAGCGLALAGTGECKKAAARYRRAIRKDGGGADGACGPAGPRGRRGEAIRVRHCGEDGRQDGRAGGGGRRRPGRGRLRRSPVSRSLGLVAACVGLGDALHDECRPREALAAYRRAAELDGKSAEARDGLAKALAAVDGNKDAGAACGR